MKLWNRDREKHIRNSNGGVVPLLGVALIIVLLTAAVYFVADYVAESYTQEDRLSGWNYLYTDRAGAVPDGEMRLFNAQNPILTESDVKKDNIYFSKIIEPSDKAKNIIFITDFAPMKIRINGKEVYNNRFDSTEYVGNCYNAITLEPSTHERQVEVFMKLPFSVRFETYLNDGEATAVTLNQGFIIGAVLAGLGLIAVIAFGAASMVRRRFYRSLFTGLIAAFVGVAVMLHLLPEVTYAMNEPAWLRLTAIPEHMTFLLTTAFLNKLFKDRRKSLVAIVFAAVISAVMLMLAFTPLLVKLTIFGMCVLTLGAMVYTAQVALVQLEHRTQFAAPVFVMCAYYAAMAVFAGVLLMTRQRTLYIYDAAVSTVVVGGVLEYIYVHDYRFEKKNRAMSVQSTRYESYVRYISQFMQSMLNCARQEEFYQTAVDELTALLNKYHPDNTDIRSCAAVRTADGFEEVVNRGVPGCNYAVIEENCLKNSKNCIFAETFLDCVLRGEGRICAVFHFEDIRDGLDVFFMSMIETAYCGLETTYENLFIRDGQREINIIFEELAENTELDNGCSVDHLRHICEYTRALCLSMGMDEEKAEHIAIASKLHDLGKIAIPKYIIHKQARLSEEERVIVNSHTEFAYTILSTYANDPMLATAAAIAKYHHERFNGSGIYGLKGKEIPVEARIVSVCDVYDALISERTYKKAWSRGDALSYLRDNEGKLFDPEICEKFIDYILEKDDAPAEQTSETV